MSDVTKNEMAADPDELSDADLHQVSGGTEDFHFTKTVDSASPTLFGTGSPTPPPPPKKA